MLLNKQITGIKNEIEFVTYLNNRKFCKLNPMFSEFIKRLYDNVEDNDTIKCYKNNTPQKTDIFIEINSVKKRISIKKGVRNSVHAEILSDFISFLIRNGVNKEVINEYLKYHYADGSTNGKGKNRRSCKEYKKENQEKIDMINECFSDSNLIKKVVQRFVIKGNNSNYEIDALIYGVVEDFLWITKDDIYKIILKHKKIYSTGVHFGSLYCQPLDRCLNQNPLYENRRYYVQIKWYHLSDDIIETMNDNVMKISGYNLK